MTTTFIRRNVLARVVCRPRSAGEVFLVLTARTGVSRKTTIDVCRLRAWRESGRAVTALIPEGASA